MKKDELIALLQRQIDFRQGKLEEALFSVRSLASANEKPTTTVDTLCRQIASLEDTVKGNDVEPSKEKAARQSIQHSQESSLERLVKAPIATLEISEQKKEKRHTGHGRRKKNQPECEIENVEVEPDNPELSPEQVRYMHTCDVVCYSMASICFIKTIYKVEKHVQGGKIFKETFQCDCYSGYRHIGIGDMGGVKKLSCLQHIKRKFLDIKDNPKEQEIAKLFGLFYHFEHRHRIGRDGWTFDEHLLFGGDNVA